MSSRLACLLVPDLPLRAELRACPELAEQPFVVTTGAGARAEVIALSAAARARGVHIRNSLAQARARCPELHVRVASPALERTARETLFDVALAFSPRAAETPRATGAFANEAGVFLDATGLGALFHSERGLASALAARAEQQGLPGVVALASSRTVTLLAARQLASQRQHGGTTTCVLATGEERAFLAPLSLDLLDPEDELAQRLTRLGVHTVRDLLRLPSEALIRRLGAGVASLIARARGEERELPLPTPRDTRIEEAIDLDHPIETLEPLRFVLSGLLSRLTTRLALRALACDRLELKLALDNGARDARGVVIRAPTRDARVLLRLTSLALQSRPPEAPVLGVTLATRGQRIRREQLDLFQPPGPDPAQLAQTLAELEAICGPDRIGTPQVASNHHPGAYAMGTPQLDLNAAEPNSSRSRAMEPPSRPNLPGSLPPSEAYEAHSPLPALRALRPPLRAHVQVDRGQPASVRSALARGDVVACAGPWRSTGHWWCETERFAFDHFDAQISDGNVVRLRFDWTHEMWQIDGIYD